MKCSPGGGVCFAYTSKTGCAVDVQLVHVKYCTKQVNASPWQNCGPKKAMNWLQRLREYNLADCASDEQLVRVKYCTKQLNASPWQNCGPKKR